MNEQFPITPAKKGWYQNPALVGISLFFCFPIGLILMWTGDVYSKTARIVVTVIFGLLLFIGMVSKHDPANAPSGSGTQINAATPPPMITDDCLAVSSLFGTGSKLSDLQKDDLWPKYKDKMFKWDLQIVEVSAGTFGGFSVQAKCAPTSKSLIQDILIHYEAGDKDAVMRLTKGSTYGVTGILKNSSSLLGLTAEGR